jgi:hypothetical protein
MERKGSMKICKLIEKASLVYNFLVEKDELVTYMSVKPQHTLVENNLKGLGFKIENAGNKKKAAVNFKNLQQDTHKLLMLSYYGM